MPKILVIDDDSALRHTLTDGLRARGHEVTEAGAAEAAELVRDPDHEVLVTDLRMPEIDGISLLGISKQVHPDRPVVVMTAFGSVDSAIESLRKGAYHYLVKPFKVAELDLFVQRALEDRALRRDAKTMKRALAERHSLENVVARSDAMREVRELVDRVADAQVSVLLVGETGTGKGLVARALHARGSRASAPFVAVNCAALPENLLESELFGHVKGAFTGATASKPGLFVEADGGTLFLDEVGDMVPALQAKLLDVIERRSVRAVGATREQAVDVRIVSATHRDLRARVAAGLFREDLLYRLEGIAIEIPPLRLRKDDIPALVDKLLADARASNPKSVVERFSREATDLLLAYPWPGNVRELEHAIGRAVLLGRGGEAGPGDLPPSIVERSKRKAEIDFGQAILPVRDVQRRYAAWALEQVGGRKSLACEKLGIDAKTLNKWLQSDDE